MEKIGIVLWILSSCRK